jgi:hypothetical protein
MKKGTGMKIWLNMSYVYKTIKMLITTWKGTLINDSHKHMQYSIQKILWRSLLKYQSGCFCNRRTHSKTKINAVQPRMLVSSLTTYILPCKIRQDKEYAVPYMAMQTVNTSKTMYYIPYMAFLYISSVVPKIFLHSNFYFFSFDQIWSLMLITSITDMFLMTEHKTVWPITSLQQKLILTILKL